jgi:dihydrofolate synthase/folylpolyglutamate synthase
VDINLAWQAFLQRLFRQNEFVIRYELESFRIALARLGLDGHPSLGTVVLIGGTNGKGTTAAMLHAACRSVGLHTALYTSPHLVDFRERMRVDGCPIPVRDAIRLGEPLLEAWGNPDCPAPGLSRPLSYFEIATLLALQWFVECGPLDVSIVEVGMGGRLDATNALDPRISILTSVSLDHQAWLGDTLEAIAAEKAWIVRAGRPCILHQDSGGFETLLAATTPHGPQVHVVRQGGSTPRAWAHDMAMCAFDLLLRDRGVELSDDALKEVERLAWARACWPGRQESRVHDGVQWWMDGAHNEASMESFGLWLRAQVAMERPRTPMPIIVGASPGKETGRWLAPLQDMLGPVMVIPASAQRSAPVSEVCEQLGVAGFTQVEPCASAAEAVERARVLSPVGPIVVSGSLYALGEVMREIGLRAEDLVVYRDPA